MPPAFEVLLLNTTIPQIQAAQSGDTYLCPRELAVVVNTATDAVRITQTGAGNALLVEDSANPDSTPFVVTAVGDVGIGTNNPSQKLQVVGGVVSTGQVSALVASSTFFDYISTNIGRFAVVGNTTGTAAPIVFSQYSSNGSVGRDAVTIDSSGNLGLGVTPSAWNTGWKAVQVGSLSSLSDTGGVTYVGNNFYQNTSSNNIYLTSNYASLYGQTAGQHRWYTAPSGTAGNTISFTQAMTLDASGNLLVGTTSGPSGTKLAVSGNIDSVSASPAMRLYTDTSTQIGGFGSGNWAFGDGTTNAAILAASGKSLLFGAGASERARITSDGEFLLGVQATTDTPNNGVVLRNYSSSTIGAVGIGHASGVGSGTNYAVFAYNGGGIGSVSQNGTTGVLYNITSDYRLKDVVGAVTDAGARIDALKPIDYTWKADGSAARGFLAHEFQAVYPNSVTGTKDAVDEEGKPVYQNMQASTSEVIADLVAELQSLRARVAQLESKGV